MDQNHRAEIAGELRISERQVEAAVGLLDDGSTVPFISRYRKEATGSLDEVAITLIRDRIARLRELDKRREAILKSLRDQDKLTDDLEEKIRNAKTLPVLEDIYLPYRPKRRTRATVAREKGLEPLAERIFRQETAVSIEEARACVDEEKGVNDVEEALAGARDIIAEWVSENREARARMRELFLEEGRIRSRVIAGKEEEGAKYRDYFDWEEPVSSAPSHRVLAMRRGEKESLLSLEAGPEEEKALAHLEALFVKRDDESGRQVRLAVKDSYRRLLKPSMETEILSHAKRVADEEAIKVFSENLHQLLMEAPLGEKNVMAVDPAFRTGCKLACLDRQGKLLRHETIYPNEPRKEVAAAAALVKRLFEEHSIEAVAIGNGTASRETEAFFRRIGLPKGLDIIMVNESGASVYSASKAAREEFPDHDVTVRGAVSIGRRLMDPLAELVKIDPRSIGVGQYQHDVDQKALKQGLDDAVTSCVNAVGVELNTASRELLAYVSGLGPHLAGNIVEHRNENGPFRSRDDLNEVPRLGPKAFEQSAGFLRIRNAENPLDATAVHPESYGIVNRMAKDLGCTVRDLIEKKERRARVDLKNYLTDTAGLPTLKDIMKELEKPGRDPRERFEAFSFAENVKAIEDLKPGMMLPGIVTNVTNFGAFVDVGVHQDGLVHVSHLSDSFVKEPNDAVKVRQKVEVTVIGVDLERKRISLSMKRDPFADQAPERTHKKKDGGGGDLKSKLEQLRKKFNN